jgi:ABC-type uncharacterized transport system involved in gliding motility auxiliary subunit
MRSRRTKFAAYTGLYAVIVLAVIVAINFLANRYNKTFDSTTNKQFTLSDQTQKIARELKQTVNISFWGGPDDFRAARDLLDRYQGLSSKIEVQYQDIDKNLTQARAAGVTRRGAVLVDVGTKHQEAKALTEEEVTGALIRALKTGERMACFVTGSGEHSLDDADRNGYASAKQIVESNNYKTQSINLIQKPEIPMDCMMVVVGGPTRDYLQPEVDSLKKFVEAGGKAIFMLDPPLEVAKANVDQNKLLTDMLAGWGVTMDKNLVLDTSVSNQLNGLGPDMPIGKPAGTHIIVRDMKNLVAVVPTARSLEIKNTGQTTLENLLQSLDDSFATTDLKNTKIRKLPSDKNGPLALAAAGEYSSGAGGAKGRFVVTGSSAWVSNSFLRLGGNRDLFLNMMNWLSADEDLISIRPKEPEDRRLSLTGAQMNLILYSSVVFVPLLIMIAGTMVWWQRR